MRSGRYECSVFLIFCCLHRATQTYLVIALNFTGACGCVMSHLDNVIDKLLDTAPRDTVIHLLNIYLVVEFAFNCGRAANHSVISLAIWDSTKQWHPYFRTQIFSNFLKNTQKQKRTQMYVCVYVCVCVCVCVCVWICGCVSVCSIGCEIACVFVCVVCSVLCVACCVLCCLCVCVCVCVCVCLCGCIYVCWD